MSTNEMKKAFVFKKLMSKRIHKKTVASIGSRAVLALALAIDCCEEIETSIEENYNFHHYSKLVIFCKKN